MRKIETLQATFEQGMQTSIKQDMQFEQRNVLTAAKYIENYDPNIELGSLIARQPYVPSDIYLPNANQDIEFISYLEEYATTFLGSRKLRDAAIQHVLEFDTNNPITHRILLLFGSGIKNDFTSDNHFVEYVSLVLNTLEKGSPRQFTNSFTDNAIYKGWLPLGRYTDSIRYGQQIYFTTLHSTLISEYNESPAALSNLDDIAKYYFPLYIYEYFDYSDARKNHTHFWNGVEFNLSVPENLQGWKVRTPLQKLMLEEVDVLYSVGMNLHQNYYGNDNSPVLATNSFDQNRWKNNENDLLDATKKGMQLLIWEQPMFDVSNDKAYYEILEDNSYLPYYARVFYNNAISHNPYFKRQFSKYGREWIPGNSFQNDYTQVADREDTVSFINSLETLNHSLPYNDFADFFDNAFSYDVVAEAFRPPTSHSPIDIINSKASPIETEEAYLSDFDRDIKYCDGGVVSGTSPIFDDEPKLQNVLIHRGIDYLEARIPRGWLAGEKIPMILTLDVNGGEVVLKEFTYTVKTDYGITNGLLGFDDVDNNFNIQSRQFPNNKSDYYEHLGFVQNPQYNLYYDPLSLITSIDSNNIVDLKWRNPVANNPVLRNEVLRSSFDYHAYKVLEPFKYHTYITITIRLDEETLSSLTEANARSLNLYASKPNLNENLFKSIGTESISDPNPAMYAKHTEAANSGVVDYTKYALVKKFLIKGQGNPYIEEWDGATKNWEKYQGQPINQNSWLKHTDNMIYAVPQEYDPSVPNDANRTNNFHDRRFPPVPTLPSAFTFTDNLNGSSLTEAMTPTMLSKDQCFTPDFILWDYPTDSEQLTLQNTGRYWEGVGAKLVTVVNGRTFIAGGINEKYEEEEAIIRYAAVDNGVVIPDVFPEENAIQIGSEPITAITEFREQLVVFTKTTIYRILMPNALDESTWKIADKLPGQGVLSPKLLTQNQDGILFANRNGIWFTNGTDVISLTYNKERQLFVQDLYQYLITGDKKSYDNVDVGNVAVKDPYNIHAELLYKNETNELIFYTPLIRKSEVYTNPDVFHNSLVALREINGIPNIGYKLILNMNYWNWKAESIDIDRKVTDTNTVYKPYTIRGRMLTNDKLTMPLVTSTTSSITKYDLFFMEKYLQAELYQDVFPYTHRPAANLVRSLTGHVITKILETHDIGNGLDDNILKEIILECTPVANKWNEANPQHMFLLDRLDQNSNQGKATVLYGDEIDWLDYLYDLSYRNRKNYATSDAIASRDPQVNVYLRKERMGRDHTAALDLIALNMQSKAASQLTGTRYSTNIFQTYAQTPAGNSAYGTSDATMQANESLALLAPLNSRNRRLHTRIVTEVIDKIRSIKFQLSVFKRRHQ